MVPPTEGSDKGKPVRKPGTQSHRPIVLTDKAAGPPKGLFLIGPLLQGTPILLSLKGTTYAGECPVESVDESQFDLAIRVRAEEDVARARCLTREFVEERGFSLTDSTKVATSVSELARNMFRYAGGGKVLVRFIKDGACEAVEVLSVDGGPGIVNIEQVLQPGYSSNPKNSLGLGLPGVRRLMDAFHLSSTVGQGTWVRILKRKRNF